jgi:hypothetical protein
MHLIPQFYFIFLFCYVKTTKTCENKLLTSNLTKCVCLCENKYLKCKI